MVLYYNNDFKKYLGLRKFSTFSPEKSQSDIFKRLNIDLQNVVGTSSQEHSYIKGYIHSLVELNKNLKEILSNNDLTLEDKQKLLEKASEINQSFEMELNYNVPTSLSKLIEKVDEVLLNSENLESEDVSPYLPSTLADKLGTHEKVTKSYKTGPLKKTIKLFKDILRVYKHMNNSIGLFLIYNLVGFLRQHENNKTIRDSINKDNKINRVIYLQGYGDVELTVLRVSITEVFGKELIHSFISLKAACAHNIRNSKRDIFALKEDKRTFEEQKMVKLFETYAQIDINSEEVIQLGIYCICVLEAANVLVDEGLVRQGPVKKSATIKIHRSYADDVLSLPSKPKNLPMIVRPGFWKKSKSSKTGNLNYGGYKFNKTLNYPAIINYHKKGVTYITDLDLQSLNYLQSNYYGVNQDFLSYIESDFKEIVSTYLRKMVDVNFLIQNHEDITDRSIKIQSLKELMSSDPEIVRLVKQFKKHQKSRSIERQLTKRREYITEQYRNLANEFFGLLHAYVIASNYKDYEFYFTVFLDGRGRIYYTGAGSAFGLQTGDFSKALIDLLGNSYNSTVHRIRNSSLYSSDLAAYKDYCSSLTKENEPFQYKRIEKNILPKTISNDASCSGTSILSGLVGFEKGLILTNVVSDGANSEKSSIYTEFLIEMQNNYPKDYSCFYYKEALKKKSKDLNISEDEFKAEINDSLLFIKNSLLQRDHAKQFVMRKNYSEGNEGRRKYIYDEVVIPTFLLSNQIMTSKKTLIYKSLCYYLAKWVEELYEETFPEISKVCKLLVENFEEKNPVTLTCPNNSDYEYQQLSYVTVKFARPNFQKNRKSDLSIHLRTDKPDFAKLQRSLVANFIHYLDSRLNFLVLDKCRENSIVVWSNHDCFYVCPTKKPQLLKFYFDSFIELLLKEDVIDHFLKVNEISLSQKDISILFSYKTARQTILDRLNRKDLKISEFILTS